MTDQIRIVPDVLAGWESSVRALPVDVGIGIQLNFTNMSRLSREYDEVATKWDENRTKMREALDSLAGALQTIREAFVEADAAMAAQARGEAG